MNYVVLIAALFTLSGCGANSIVSREEAEMVVSIAYDDVPCQQLAGQRNGLARQAGVSTDAKVTFSPVWAGFGTVVPDYRSQAQREQAVAVGKIAAMNDSLARRCGAKKTR